MLERSVQVITVAEPSKAPLKRAFVVWRPSLERDPQFNPFSNLVDRLTMDQDGDRVRHI